MKGKKSFTVKWKKSDYATGYKIQYSLKKSMKGSKTVTVGNVISKKINGLKAKKTYYVRVKAVNAAGESGWSSASSKKKIEIREEHPMSKTEKLNEEQVFKQEVADDELVAVTGGEGDRPIDYILPDWCIPDEDYNNCIGTWHRNIYEGAFPNCAASVEDGSLCNANDACNKIAVDYQGMTDCWKAWR